MNINLMVLPIAAQILLTILLYVKLLPEKNKAVKAGGFDRAKASLYQDLWPDNVVKVNNNIRSQFELPMLFYVLAIVLMVMDKVSVPALVLAVTFVVFRYAHSWVHTTSNYVPLRLRCFTLSSLALIGLLVLTIVASF